MRIFRDPGYDVVSCMPLPYLYCIFLCIFVNLKTLKIAIQAHILILVFIFHFQENENNHFYII